MPLFFAADAIDIYLEAADDIFRPNGLRAWGISLVIFGFLFLFGSTCYICGYHIYNNPKKWKAFEEMKVFLKEA